MLDSLHGCCDRQVQVVMTLMWHQNASLLIPMKLDSIFIMSKSSEVEKD